MLHLLISSISIARGIWHWAGDTQIFRGNKVDNKIVKRKRSKGDLFSVCRDWWKERCVSTVYAYRAQAISIFLTEMQFMCKEYWIGLYYYIIRKRPDPPCDHRVTGWNFVHRVQSQLTRSSCFQALVQSVGHSFRWNLDMKIRKPVTSNQKMAFILTFTNRRFFIK
jgi:hypothetical protein